MSRHLDNLERLCNKFNQRYGEQDSLCVQAREALEARRAQEQQSLKQPEWSVPYGALIHNQQSEFMQQVQRPVTRPHSAS